MAKLAKVTYGTHGDTNQYTYVVSDTVRTGDFIHPAVKHYKSGKVFGTTGIIQSTAKETGKNGQKIMQELQEKGIEPKSAYTGKEVGAKAERDARGRFSGSTGGMGKTVKNEETGLRQAQEGKNFQLSQYVQQAREGNVQKRLQQETFDSYSKPYMNENENKGE